MLLIIYDTTSKPMYLSYIWIYIAKKMETLILQGNTRKCAQHLCTRASPMTVRVARIPLARLMELYTLGYFMVRSH